MLYEHTAISKKPEELAKKELAELREEDRMSPDLVFRNSYILDFSQHKGHFQRKGSGISHPAGVGVVPSGTWCRLHVRRPPKAHGNR